MSETVSTYRAMQVRAAEAPLLAAGEPLMRRAAAALAAVVGSSVSGVAHPRALVLVGTGDNGGDALFAAALLRAEADVDLLLVADRFHGDGLAAAVAAGARVVELPAARDAASDYHVIVDGILGIGGAGASSASSASSGSSALRGTAREVVEALLGAPRAGIVVAVDLPSGLHPDSGEADDAVLPADVTVTFGAVKAGLVTGRGPELCGRVVLVELGLDLRDEVPAGEAAVDRVVRG